MASIVTQVVDVATLFGDVAATDPLSALLLLLGAVLTAGASAVLGLLVLGAAVDLLLPDRVGVTRRPEA